MIEPADARRLALELHGDQSYADHPYVYHLDRVRELVSFLGPHFEVAALLHDSIEDTPATSTSLLDRGVASSSVGLVVAVTKPKGVAYHAYVEALAAQDKNAALLKLADNATNFFHLTDHTGRLGQKYTKSMGILCGGANDQSPKWAACAGTILGRAGLDYLVPTLFD